MWVQGEVQILGQTRKGLLADDPELAERLKVGMVFQNGALFDSLTVGENVGFMLYEHTSLPHERVQVSCAFLLAGNCVHALLACLSSFLFVKIFRLLRVLELHLLVLHGLQAVLDMPTDAVWHMLRRVEPAQNVGVARGTGDCGGEFSSSRPQWSGAVAALRTQWGHAQASCPCSRNRPR